MTTRAVLRISAPDLDPDAVSRSLGVAPTTMQRRGEPQRFAQGLVHGEGVWALKSGLPDVLQLSAHVEVLVDRLEFASDAVARLRERGADVVIECAIAGSDGGERLTLDDVMLARLAALRVTLVLDVAGE